MFEYKRIYKNGGALLEHRLVMEKYLGRKLTKKEIIHHVDENPKNNNIKNLRIMTLSEHTKIHRKKAEMIKLICAQCGTTFLRSKKRYEYKRRCGQSIFLCSRKCTGIVNKKYLPHERECKYKKVIDKELKKGLTGYAISEKYNLNKGTVYNYINKKK